MKPANNLPNRVIAESSNQFVAKQTKHRKHKKSGEQQDLSSPDRDRVAKIIKIETP